MRPEIFYKRADSRSGEGLGAPGKRADSIMAYPRRYVNLQEQVETAKVMMKSRIRESRTYGSGKDFTS